MPMGMTTPLPLGGYRTWLQRSFLFYLACTLVLAGQFIIALLGRKAAKEVDTHKDIQLEAAIKFLNTPTQKNTPSPKK